MKAVRLFVCMLLTGALLAGAHAQSRFVHTEGKYLVAPDGKRLLLRGINLGNWMEAEGYMFHFEGGPQSPHEIEAFFNELVGPTEAASFWRRWRDTYITEKDIQLIRKAGFNSIRVPLHYRFLRRDEDGRDLLDRVVAWSAKAGLYVILDLHCAPGGQTGTNIDDSWGYPWLYEDAKAQQQTIDVWKRLAEHYRDNPTVLGYDLLNEPIPHFPQLQKYNDQLEPLYKRIVEAVRSMDPNHIVILGGAQWDSNFKIFGPPFDKNVMYTFHKYWTPPTKEVIQSYLDYRDKYNVPIWLGESGENTDDWIDKFVQVLETNEIGWAFWPYKKMDATSSVVSIEKPVYWDEIVAFAKMPGGTGEAEKRIAARPSLEHSKAALDDLLAKIQADKCRVNAGYLHALGLQVPEHGASSGLQ